MPSGKTVLRVSVRLSDRKRDSIQRGTGNVERWGIKLPAHQVVLGETGSLG